MKARIAPSILSFGHADLLTPVRSLVEAGMEVLHLDVMDGQFVPPITIGAGVAQHLSSEFPDLFVEAHLMTLTPERHFEAFLKAGCQRITFHVEATPHAHRLAQGLRQMGAQAGIALNPGTPVSAVEPLLDAVDLVLVMTVNPGWGGQTLIPSTLEKVRQVRSLRLNMEIEVDGGIDLHTLGDAREAGANLLVAGSHLNAYPTPGEGYRALASRCD
jgi:ribulose-phosphate 3-epimerase